MLAALKSERVVDMSDMEMQLEAAPQENREGRPYLGSVAFYKHVILFFVFLLFVLLTGTVIFFSALPLLPSEAASLLPHPTAAVTIIPANNNDNNLFFIVPS